MKKVDYHIHTNLSDGLLSPEEVVKLACTNNCDTISITDHEIISDFHDLATKYNIEIIPGIEFNTAISSMHILGYGITNMQLVNDKMLELAKKNEAVCYQVVDLLHQKGYDISTEKVLKYIKELNLKGDIINKRHITKYLIHKGYTKDILDTYNRLIGQNTPCYVPNYKITPEEIIDLIDISGGFSVLAHPNTINLPKTSQYELIKKLIKQGLLGIEIYNEGMQMNDKMYTQIADDFNILKTIGSDFHDPKISKIGFDVDDEMYNQFKETNNHKKRVKKMI